MQDISNSTDKKLQYPSDPWVPQLTIADEKSRSHLQWNQPTHWPYAATPLPFLVKTKNGQVNVTFYYIEV